MKRALSGYAGAVISVILFLTGLVLSTFGLILMGYPVAGLPLLIPGLALIVGSVWLFRRSLSF